MTNYLYNLSHQAIGVYVWSENVRMGIHEINQLVLSFGIINR